MTLGEARNRLRAVVRPKADRLNGRLTWTPHLTWILRSADQGDGAVDSGRLLELLLAEEEGVARFILSDGRRARPRPEAERVAIACYHYLTMVLVKA